MYSQTDNSTGAARTYRYDYLNDGSVDRVEMVGEITGEIEEDKDKQGRILSRRIEFDNRIRWYHFEYEKYGSTIEPDNRLEQIVLPSGEPVRYVYDGLGRITERRITFPGTGGPIGSSGSSGSGGGIAADKYIRETYNFVHGMDNDRTTEYVSNILYQGNGYSTSTVYAYDERGNIQSVTEGGRRTSYEYDGLNRLTRENNEAMGFTKAYEYDTNGNIVRIKEYNYTTGTLNDSNKRTEYEYEYESEGARRDRLRLIRKKAGNSNLETEIGNNYDNLGNPCKYKGSVIEWKQGRLMRTYGSKTYQYDASGIRTEKVSNGTTYKYYTLGGEIQSETRTQNGVTTNIWYYYDKSGICGIEYNGTEYYFQKDIQGDVVRIVNGRGETVARYVYDAWGNHKVLNGTGAENTSETFIGNINPIRYRGYYYDTDTGFYYLQSRYYDPEVGRFINADDITYVAPLALAACDLYGYCGNNPVMNVDPNGHEWWKFWEWDWAKIGMIALSVVEIIGGIALTFFTSGIGAPIGAGLIGVGIGSIGSAISNEKNGGSFAAGWIGGQVGGLLSIIPGIGPALGSFLNSIIVDVIDKGNIDWGKAGISSFIGFVFGYFSYTVNMGSSNDVLVQLVMGAVSGLSSLIKIIIDQFGF